MVFYLSLIGLALMAWLVFITLTGVAPILSFSIVGLICFVVILIAMRQGYIRGRRREMVFACTLIVLYGLRDFVVNIVVGIYNWIFSLVIAQLNNQGVTRVNIEQSSWKLDKTGLTIFEIMIFFAGAVIAYGITSGSLSPRPLRDPFGALIGGLAGALFLTYSFMLLSPFLGQFYQTALLDGASLKLPSINLPDLRIHKEDGSTPFGGWERWLPVGLLVVVTIYVIFFYLIRPPTTTDDKNRTRLDLLKVVGIAIALALVWRFAVIPSL
jgi:hypothetical protein